MSARTQRGFVYLGLFLAVCLLAVEAGARGRGGGGGRGGGHFSRGGGGMGGGSFGAGRPNISRSGPASNGSFDAGRGGSSNRGFASPDLPGGGDRIDRQDIPEHRKDDLEKRQEERQDALEKRRDELQDDREDYYEDQWDDVTGATLSAANYRALNCTSETVVVNGVKYYNCGTTWYNRTYVGGSVGYVAVSAPPGH